MCVQSARVWHCYGMTNETKAKVEKLHGIILENYKAAGNYNPAFAAKCAMDLILKMVFSQPKHVNQLLDEEIEDNLKVRNASNA